MFNGVFGTNSYNTQSYADMGAQRALGINGSVTNYINKGTTAKGDYVTFSTKQPQQAAKSKKFDIGKIVTAALVIGGAVFAFKKGGKAVDKLKTLFNKGKAAETATSSMGGLKKKLAQWDANRKIAKINSEADRKIANIDLKAFKKELQANVAKAKEDAAQKVKQYKHSVK